MALAWQSTIIIKLEDPTPRGSLSLSLQKKASVAFDIPRRTVRFGFRPTFD
jgi:hypothetical protein